MKLAGYTAVVTAGAQGLGEAIARALAREGAFVAMSDINEAELGRVAQEIRADGGEVEAKVVDATSAAQINAWIGGIETTRGAIDILVNAAGGFDRFAPLVDIEEAAWERTMQLNLTSAFLCAKAAGRGMIARNKGRIISIASLGGVGPNPYGPSYLPYGAAKAGLIGFTKHLAKELGPHGITVNTVSPSTTLTPRVRKVRDEASIERIRSQSPMGALVEPIDCAEAVVFLASDEARYITGVNLNVNAGTLIV